MELIIKERNQVDNIEFNYPELKKELSDSLAKYKGITYDDSAIKLAKKERASLNNLKKAIDEKRKEIKKECLKPYEDFEMKVKEILNMIDKPTLEIDTQIKNYEEKIKLEKKLEVEKLIKEVITEQELNEKYGSQLTVIDKYCNGSSKEKDTIDDLTARAMTLRVEQDREAELIDIIKDTIESENEKINTKLNFTDFQRYIDRGVTTKEILQEIKTRAETIFRAENPPKVVEQANIPQPQEVTPKPIVVPVHENKTYFAEYRIVGSIEQLKSVSKFLQDNGIKYTTGEQGEI